MHALNSLRRVNDSIGMYRHAHSFSGGMTIALEQLFLSPGHNFFGHHGSPPGQYPAIPRAELECVAGRGIRGDRFFDYRPDYPGQITFFALEVFEELCAALKVTDVKPAVLRRNVFTRGVDLRSLIGREFEMQGVRFHGACECKPCYWMDGVVGTGAEAWLLGRGGLRAKILSDGVLSAGQADLVCATEFASAAA
jgi:hypothetical protein